jgi:hypothetical protein
MVEANGSGERDALLRHSPSSGTLSSIAKSSRSVQSVSDAERNGEDGEASTMSRSRGALIIASIGLLIFLQGTFHFISATPLLLISVSTSGKLLYALRRDPLFLSFSASTRPIAFRTPSIRVLHLRILTSRSNLLTTLSYQHLHPHDNTILHRRRSRCL